MDTASSQPDAHDSAQAHRDVPIDDRGTRSPRSWRT